MVLGEMRGYSAQIQSRPISAYVSHFHAKAFLTVPVPLHWPNSLRLRRVPHKNMRRPLLPPNLPRRDRPTSYMGYDRRCSPRHGNL
jgi:hypothetical protein